MKFNNLYLESFASLTPDTFLSTEEIESELSDLYSRCRFSHGRIELQTGVKRRGYFDQMMPSAIAALAAKKILNDENKDRIDLLIHASVCRDFLEPATAARVHHLLDLKEDCMISDISNACLGVLSSILFAGQLIESGKINSALIVSGENAGPLIKETLKKLKMDQSIDRKTFKPFLASLTIGSAGVAFILSGDKSKARAKINGGVTLTFSKASELCVGDGSTDGLMMQTDSEELLLQGLELAKKNWLKYQEQFSSVPDKIIPHQVGVAHRFSLLNQLGLPLDRDFITFDLFGNTGSAAVPLSLIKASEAQFFQQNDKIALLGIGSGLTSTMMELEWIK